MMELNQISKLYRRLRPAFEALETAKKGLEEVPSTDLDNLREYADTIRTMGAKVNNLLRDNNLPLDTLLHLHSDLEFAVWCSAQWD